MDEQKMADGLVFISASAKTLEGTNKNFKGRIKNMVTSAGLNTTEDKDRALWIVEATGEARKDNEDDGIYFSYVDINLDITNAVTGEAIHSGTLVVPGNGREGIKGGSVKSFEDAVDAAYLKAYSLIKEEVKRINNQSRYQL